MYGSAYSYNLVGIDIFRRFFTEEFLDYGLYTRDTCRTADEYHLVYVGFLQTRFGQCLFHRLYGTVDQLVCKFLELRQSERHHKVLRSGSVSRYIRQVDFGLRRRRKLYLGFFSSLADTLHSLRIGTEVYSFGLFKL